MSRKWIPRRNAPLMSFLSEGNVNHIVEAAGLARDTMALYVQATETIPPHSLGSKEIMEHPLGITVTVHSIDASRVRRPWFGMARRPCRHPRSSAPRDAARQWPRAYLLRRPRLCAIVRKGFPADLIKVARRKLRFLHAAHILTDLRVSPGNRLEALKGNRAGQYSNSRQRPVPHLLCWTPEGPKDVELTDYH